MRLRSVALLVVLLALPALPATSNRLARMSIVEGAVTLFNTTTGESEPAKGNRRVSTGHSLTTGSDSHAELRLGASVIRLDAHTDLDLRQLDDMHLSLRLNRGSLILDIRSADQAKAFVLETPQGLITLSAPSNLRVDVRDDAAITTLEVRAGGLRFDGGSALFALAAGRRADVVGPDLRKITASNRRRTDSFDTWNLARERYTGRAAKSP